MKRIISLFLIVIILFSGCTVQNEEKEQIKEIPGVSAVWIFYSELSMLNEKGGNESLFRTKISDMFDNCISRGINTVFLQVRPCADSFYKSSIFPWSYYLTGDQGKAVSYDPLKICIEEAHERKLSLHAWINPFRIAFNDDISKLSDNHPAMKWIGKKTSDVVFVNGGIYFSPASLDAQRLVLDGVREIIKNYDVDGIHIDDYFYPSVEAEVDAAFYKKYTESGGDMSLKDWRLNMISAFVSQMYNVVKSENKDCIFSVSPAGNIQNNYNEQYADVKLWCSQKGYADWIIPQLYYGFENDTLLFDTALEEWTEIHTNSEIKMIYGIAAYKVNDSDDEWIAGRGMIDKQLKLIKDNGSAYGVAFFSYSSIIDEKRSAEFEKLSTVLA